MYGATRLFISVARYSKNRASFWLALHYFGRLFNEKPGGQNNFLYIVTPIKGGNLSSIIR